MPVLASRRELRLSGLLSVLVFLSTPVAADDLGTVDEVLECVRANLPEKTSVQLVEFRSADRTGGGRTILSKIHWRRFENGLSKVLIRVKAPTDLKDAGVLLLEKKDGADMFVYLPDLRKVRRVTTRMLSGSLFGSDFTYEDFTQLQGMALEGQSERLPDAELDGVPVFVISHRPAQLTGSGYERVKTYVAAEDCVPLRSEMYEKGDRLRKVLSVDREAIFESDGVRLPQMLVMEDIRDESRTQLVITEIEIGKKISRKVFSSATLERPGSE